MQITGTLQLWASTGEAAVLERLDTEIARIQDLSDNAIESLCTVFRAADVSDVSRRLCRFAAAAASPSAMLGRALERDPHELARFAWQLAAYRYFMERVEAGDDPRAVADDLARARRAWLEEELRDTAPESVEDEADVDVHDAEGEIDPGAVRAEIRRLMYRLGVDPERIRIEVLPDDGIADAPRDRAARNMDGEEPDEQ